MDNTNTALKTNQENTENNLTGSPVQEEVITKRRRTVLRLAVLGFFFSQGLCFSSWASRIPDIKNMLHLSEAGLGSILLALPAGQLTAMPISGRLVTRFSSKTIMPIAIILYAAALLHIGLVGHAWHLALALYLFGICGNLVNISVNTQAVSVEALLKRPLMTSFHGGWSIAGFTGAGIGTLMIAEGFPPFVHYCFVAALVLFIVLIGRKHLLQRKGGSYGKKAFFSKPDKALMILGLIGFCSMASEGAMFDWSGVYFQKVVKAPASQIMLGYAAFMCTMATGRFLGDGLTRRLGQKRLLQISGVLIATGLCLSVLFPYILPVAIAFSIVGFGVSAVVPTVNSAAGKIGTTAPGIAMATVSSISFLGFLIGPPLIGYVAELGSLRASFVVVAILGFCTTLLATKAKVMR